MRLQGLLLAGPMWERLMLQVPEWVGALGEVRPSHPRGDHLFCRYPDRIPVIVERADRTNIPDIDKKK